MKGWRLVGQLFVLVGMIVAAMLDGNMFANLMSIILIPLPVINWGVALILIWTARQAPDIVSLVERADDAVTLALTSTAGSIIAINSVARVLGFGGIDRVLVLALLAFALMMVTVPALGWLRVWRSQWFPMIRNRRE